MTTNTLSTLALPKPQSTHIVLQMVDQVVNKPKGIIEDFTITI